jgi:NADH-quinone oxidoreductase subunit L
MHSLNSLLLSEGGGGSLTSLAPLLIVFPIAGLLINILAGKKLGDPWAGIIASFASGFSFVIAVLLFVGLWQTDFHAAEVHIADWIVIGSLNIPWAFQIDTLSVTMMLLVTGVGTLIHIYAIGYMHGDERFPRFFIYLNLFITAMLILVGGNNYLMLFLGWEGVGLCSFLLIGFWFDKGAGGVGNARAGRKAFVVNRVGDFGFALAMFLIFWTTGSLTFNNVFDYFKEHGGEGGTHAAITVKLSDVGTFFAPPGDEEHPEGESTEISITTIATAITLLLMLGAAGKSAQIPLFVWLPDAMAGPTPVSALIHAATMVTAGIYMIVRSNVIFALAPASQITVAIIGASTAFLAGTIAVGQFDIKRVLAYSTISQLGFMIAAAGMGAYVAAMFHLLTHAFFKALLFLSSGSVIHGMEHGHHALAHDGVGGGGDDHDAHAHEAHGATHGSGHSPAHEDEHAFDPQDMRNMGGLRKHMPTTFWVYLIGSLALAGVFPLAGFWSKDEILADAWKIGIVEGQWHGVLVYALLTVAALFTAFYMGRQVFMVFFGSERTPAAEHAHESSNVMLWPLRILAVLSVFGGLLNLPVLLFGDAIGDGLGRWIEHTVEVHPLDFNIVVAGVSTVVALVAIGIAYLIYGQKPMVTGKDPLEALGGLFTFLNGKWYIDELYQKLIIGPFEDLSRFTAYALDWELWHDLFHENVIAGGFKGLANIMAWFVDKRLVDGFFNGLGSVVRETGLNLKAFQSGYVRNYALMVLIGVIALLSFFLFMRS